jgi:hypothetical protein
VKFTVCALAILFPVLSWAQLAGDWAGVIADGKGAHGIVLHISGPFSAMKASADIPDQNLSSAAVESIAFSDSTLEFSIPAAGAQYSGVLNDSGSISGTLTQHSSAVPLS